MKILLKEEADPIISLPLIIIPIIIFILSIMFNDNSIKYIPNVFLLFLLIMSIVYFIINFKLKL